MQLGSAWRDRRENWRTVREKLPVSSAWRAVREKLPMPRGRLARSLASTAVIVVLSAAAGGKAAGPLVGARVDAASLPPAGSAAPAAKMAETPKAAPAAVVPVDYSPRPFHTFNWQSWPRRRRRHPVRPVRPARMPPLRRRRPPRPLQQAVPTPPSPNSCTMSRLANSTASSASRRIGPPSTHSITPPRLRADVDHRRQFQFPRRGGYRLSRPSRCRRPRSRRLSDAGLCVCSAILPALAEAEIRLTASIMRYAHHAQVGRVHWTRVSGDILV